MTEQMSDRRPQRRWLSWAALCVACFVVGLLTASGDDLFLLRRVTSIANETADRPIGRC